MPFHCVIVTPDEQLLDATLRQAILPTHDGLMGILTGHSPLLVKLGVGPLQADLADGKSQKFFVEGGIAQMKDNELTVLTSSAIPADAIDAAAAQAEYAEAAARKPTDSFGAAEREKQMQRASAKQRIAAKQ